MPVAGALVLGPGPELPAGLAHAHCLAPGPAAYAQAEPPAGCWRGPGNRVLHCRDRRGEDEGPCVHQQRLLPRPRHKAALAGPQQCTSRPRDRSPPTASPPAGAYHEGRPTRPRARDAAGQAPVGGRRACSRQHSRPAAPASTSSMCASLSTHPTASCTPQPLGPRRYMQATADERAEAQQRDAAPGDEGAAAAARAAAATRMQLVALSATLPGIQAVARLLGPGTHAFTASDAERPVPLRHHLVRCWGGAAR